MGSIVQLGSAAPADAPADEDGAEAHQYLTFTLGPEVFAIGILSVREILEYHRPTPVPMSPPWIRGVINLRGQVVPVVDLQMRFGRPSTEPNKRTCVVIVEVAAEDGQIVLGVVVDAVSAVLDIPPDQVEPAPEFGAKLRTEFMKGLGKVDGRFVILLDIERVLSVAELSLVAGFGRAEAA